MILQTGNNKSSAFSAQCSYQSTKKRKWFLFSFLTTDHRQLTAKKGVTLIEVLLAVSILGIGMVGVLRAYAGSISTLEVGQYSIDALNVMKQKIADVEQMILEDGEIQLMSDNGTMEDFLWEWNIDSTDAENLYELVLTVSHKNNPRTFSLETYVLEKEEEL